MLNTVWRWQWICCFIFCLPAGTGLNNLCHIQPIHKYWRVRAARTWIRSFTYTGRILWSALNDNGCLLIAFVYWEARGHPECWVQRNTFMRIPGKWTTRDSSRYHKLWDICCIPALVQSVSRYEWWRAEGWLEGKAWQNCGWLTAVMWGAFFMSVCLSSLYHSNSLWQRDKTKTSVDITACQMKTITNY